jgi:hypothetical protein
MKKIFSIIAILAIVFAVSSCGNKKKKDSQAHDTHVHEDGSVHENHDNDTPAQESFEVKEDSDAHQHNTDEHAHEHGDEAGHDHDNGEHK